MRSKVTFFLLLAAMVCMIGTSAHAMLNVDENFDGAQAFQDQNWSNDYPKWNSAPDGADAVAPKTPDTQGVNISTSLADGAEFAHVDGDTKTDVAKMQASVSATSATVVTARAFSGTKSMQITSGGSVSFPRSLSNWGYPAQYHIFQFALAVDPAVSAQAAGTQVGKFYIDYATDKNSVSVGKDAKGTDVMRYMDIDGATIVTFELQLKVNSDGNVDLYANKIGDGNTKLGTIYPVTGSWAMVSIVDQINVKKGATNSDKISDPLKWGAWDPIKGKFVSPDAGLTEAEAEGKYNAKNESGITVYVNSTTAAGKAGIYDIDPSGDWGNSKDVTGDATPEGTSILDFGFQAMNGGAIYVDDVYQSRIIVSKAESMHQEWASRISEFNDNIGVEGAPVIPAAAKVWSVY